MPSHCACVQHACPRLEPDSPAVPAPRAHCARRPRRRRFGSPQPAAPTHNILHPPPQAKIFLEKITREDVRREVVTAREEVRRLLELARSSQGVPTGFEGVYSSGAGFGAELRKGAKRLRQTGFSSPFEAALERARWAKLADLGLSMRLPSAQSLPW